MPGLPRPGALAKPTIDTRFHIDYDWWDNPAQLRLYMLSHLPNAEARERLGQHEEGTIVDYVHPDTGEVFRYDELQLAIQTAAQEEGFIDPQASMVDNIFRVFLRNGNQPRTPRELESEVDKPANIILRTIGGTTVYKGIRPYVED
jgi:hypothetical protein